MHCQVSSKHIDNLARIIRFQVYVVHVNHIKFFMNFDQRDDSLISSSYRWTCASLGGLGSPTAIHQAQNQNLIKYVLQLQNQYQMQISTRMVWYSIQFRPQVDHFGGWCTTIPKSLHARHNIQQVETSVIFYIELFTHLTKFNPKKMQYKSSKKTSPRKSKFSSRISTLKFMGFQLASKLALGAFDVTLRFFEILINYKKLSCWHRPYLKVD